MSRFELCETLAACSAADRGEGATILPSLELEATLESVLSRARAAFPDLGVSNEAFLAFLAPHLPTGRDPIAVLRSLHTTDVYLAAACSLGVPLALATFDERFLASPTPVLSRMRLPPDVVDEARQVLRARFFVGGAPRIAHYSGTGPLRGWVRAALVREALRLLRAPKARGDLRGDLDGETLTVAASPDRDLELDYLKRLYGAAADDALHEGFSQLDVRERNVLRQHFALGLGIDAIAALYHVHRATAARWITRAREVLVARTRDGIRRRLQLAPEEVSSILRLIESQLAEGVRVLFAVDVASG